MPIKRKDFEKLFADFRNDQIATLSRHQEMLSAFYAESDWAFLIKCHALIEAVVTESLVKALGESRIHRVVSRMPLGGEMGKMKMAKEIGILSERQEKFVACLSSIRNKLVHKVENLDFDFKAYVVSLSKADQKKLFQGLVWQDVDAALSVKWREHFDNCPRFVVLVFLLPLLSIVALHAAHRDGEREIARLANATADEIFDSLMRSARMSGPV